MDAVYKYKKNMTIRISYIPEDSFSYKDTILAHSIKKENGYVISKPYRLGIELEHHVGGVIRYGYISVHIIPGDQGKIGVAFDYEKKLNEEILKGSIYHGSYRGMGLSDEFRQELETSVVLSLEMTDAFPWCNIICDQFMYCEVGSSINFYDIIIRMILGIIKDNLQQEIMNLNIGEFITKYKYLWNYFTTTKLIDSVYGTVIREIDHDAIYCEIKHVRDKACFAGMAFKFIDEKDIVIVRECEEKIVQDINQYEKLYIGCESTYIKSIKETFIQKKRTYGIEILFLVYSDVHSCQIIFEELMENVEKRREII